jgi:hypothetical protein
MAMQARDAIGSETLSVVADRGYFKGEEILACYDANITAYVPKPMTSGAKADGVEPITHQLAISLPHCVKRFNEWA